jgi:hypothetical protein
MTGGRTRGIWLILLAALLALIAASYDYVTPATGIDHSGGVILVIVSSGLMLCGALLAALLGRGVLASILMVLIVLDIAGTGFAAWLLESGLLMAAMLLALIGWLLRIAARAGKAA